ncbi:UNVERIFIED_CONTAM: hypothetical protein GTU68_062268 [Idotea baltica]|nr:hypothetical protein [Idotea baltica]
MSFIAIIIVMSLIGGWVTTKMKRRMQLYSTIPVQSGWTGAQTAQAMLAANHVNDVQVVRGEGFLTDHYHPKNKVISLSPSVYDGMSVAATSVAAHECGHAVQHHEGYGFLSLRTAMVPLVKVASRVQQVLLIAALLMYNSFPGLMIFLVGAFVITTLFAVLTLPVEFDASRRALNWLDQSGAVDAETYKRSEDALKWAAMTYVAQALSAFVILLYFGYNFISRRN